MKILQFVGVLSFRRLNPFFFALSVCLIATLPLPGLAAKKIILDTDPGSDDALALMLALNSPELDVRAITVVPGNVTAAMGLENALRMVSLANRCDIPVAAGAQHPLFQKLITAGCGVPEALRLMATKASKAVICPLRIPFSRILMKR